MSVDVRFPYGFDVFGRTALVDTPEHIDEMIEQVLFTSAGERVMLPEFGSGLLQAVFDPGSAEVAAALQFTVQAGLQRWLGDVVEIRELSVMAEDATLTVDVGYVVKLTEEVRTRVFSRGLL
jgi:phage baseplate assembly protein W